MPVLVYFRGGGFIIHSFGMPDLKTMLGAPEPAHASATL
jgi:hypothetical protein